MNKDKVSNGTISKSSKRKLKASDDSLNCGEDTVNFTSGKHANVELLHLNKSMKEQKPVRKGHKRYSKQFPKPRLCNQPSANMGITSKNNKKSCEAKLSIIDKNQNNDSDFHSTNFIDPSCKNSKKKYPKTNIINDSENYVLRNKEQYCCNSLLKKVKRGNKHICIKKTCNASIQQNKRKKRILNVDMFKCVKESIDASSHISSERNISDEFCSSANIKNLPKVKKIYKKDTKSAELHLTNKNDNSCTKGKKNIIIKNGSIKKSFKKIDEIKSFFKKKNRIEKVEKGKKNPYVLLSDDDANTNMHMSDSQNKSYDFFENTTSKKLNNASLKQNEIKNFAAHFDKKNKELGVLGVTEKHRKKLQFKSDYYRMTNKELLSAGDYYKSNHSAKECKKGYKTVVKYGTLYENSSSGAKIGKISQNPLLCKMRIKNNENDMGKAMPLKVNFFHVDKDSNKAFPCDSNNINTTKTNINTHEVVEPIVCITLSDDESCLNLHDSRDINMKIDSISDFNTRKFSQKCNQGCIDDETKLRPLKLSVSNFLINSNDSQGFNSNDKFKVRPNLENLKKIEISKRLTDSNDCIIVSDDSCDREKAKGSPFTKSAKENHDLESDTIRKNSDKSILSDDEKEKNLMTSHDCQKLNNDVPNEVCNSSREKIKFFNDLREFLEPDPVDFPVSPLHVKESSRRLPVAEINKIRSMGIKVRTGKFTKKEDTILKQNWQKIVAKYSLLQKPVCLLGIGSGRRRKQNLDFMKAKHIYLRLAHGLDDRTLNCIYKRARRLFHPARNLDKLTHKEITKIIKLQKVLGNNWERIGEIIGRPPYCCMGAYDWWHKTEMQRGLWSSKESQSLYDAVKRLIKKGQHENPHGFWEKVSSLVATRNSIQCRKHWLNKYSWKVVPKERRKWSKQDYARLVYLIKKNITYNETEVDWKYVSNSFVHCSPSYLSVQRRWFYLKSLVPKDDAVSLQKTVDYLYFTYVPQILDNICMQEFQGSC